MKDIINAISRFLHKLRHTRVDKLIDHCGESVGLSNGVNYNREFMFFYDRHIKKVPADYPYLKICIGEYISGYGDWGYGFSRASDSMVDIYIDSDRIICYIDRKTGFYNGVKYSRGFENKTNRLVSKLKVGDKFRVGKYSDLNRFIDKFFEYKIDDRYCTRVSVVNLDFGDTDKLKQKIEMLSWQLEHSKEEAGKCRRMEEANKG